MENYLLDADRSQFSGQLWGLLWSKQWELYRGPLQGVDRARAVNLELLPAEPGAALMEDLASGNCLNKGRKISLKVSSSCCVVEYLLSSPLGERVTIYFL